LGRASGEELKGLLEELLGEVVQEEVLLGRGVLLEVLVITAEEVLNEAGWDAEEEEVLEVKEEVMQDGDEQTAAEDEVDGGPLLSAGRFPLWDLVPASGVPASAVKKGAAVASPSAGAGAEGCHPAEAEQVKEAVGRVLQPGAGWLAMLLTGRRLFLSVCIFPPT
jgi:hypothetical protein